MSHQPTPPTIWPEVHGHRGCRGLFPENTLPAFQRALELGVDALELDVVVSQDGQLVVSHEPWLAARLGRGPQGERIDPMHERRYNIYQMPYATIERCIVGEWQHPDFSTQQPLSSHRPLLREVLHKAESWCQQHGRPTVRYSIEIKSNPEGDDLFHPAPTEFVRLALAELRAAGVMARTTLLSFDPRVLRAAREAQSDLALCFLLEDELPAIPALFKELGFEPSTLGPDFQLLSTPIVQAIRAAYPALRLVPWTVNSPADLRLVYSWQVEGITTDYPDRLLALLGKM
jgi:glycerophosphoryl diester phosphodiesterase